MKRSLLISLFALAVVSCTEETRETVQEPVADLCEMELKALPEGIETRTMLQGKSVVWSSSDEISLFDGSGNRKFSVQTINADGSAVFKGEAAPGAAVYYATYPYDAAHYLTGDGTSLRTGFYSAQTASAPDSFDNGFNTAVAVVRGGNLSFYNLGGLIRFTLTGNNVMKATLTAHDGGTVGGVYFVSFTPEGAIASSTLASSRETMTLRPSSGETFSAGNYYFCVSARTYSGGIQLALETIEGETISVGTNADVVVERSKITSIGTVDTAPDRYKRVLQFTPIDQMNTAESVNSHAGYTSFSSLLPIAGTEVSIGNDIALDNTQPQYPRFLRTEGGKCLMFYHPSGGSVSASGNASHLLGSDNLLNWSYSGNPFSTYKITDCAEESNTRGYAGAHPLRLPDGRILAVASTRAIHNYRDRNSDNGLSIRISADEGETWGEEQIVYVGTNWEPMPVLLPDGRIQIYYTDSQKMDSEIFGPGKTVVTTGVSYIESSDGGNTWQYGTISGHARAFAQVRYTSGTETVLTDQMPAVIPLNGSSALAAAAESFIGGASYTSYISLVYSGADGSWGTPDSNGVLPSDRNNNAFTGSAPYLVQFPSGETVLSYNRNDVFYYRMGGADARSFGSECRFFSGVDGYWGSMYLWNSHRMLAGIGGQGNCLKIGQFYLNHALSIASHPVTVDSRNNDWLPSDEALWLCSGASSKATVRCAGDDTNLYFLVEVEDPELSESDYLDILLAGSGGASSAVSIRANLHGAVGTLPGGASLRAAYDGSLSSGDTDHGYLVEISVPLQSLPSYADYPLLNVAMYDVGNGGLKEIAPSAGRWIPLLCVAPRPLQGVSEPYQNGYIYELQ